MRRPVDAKISQGFGDNPTSTILPGSPDYWIIEQFGNYQPDGHTGEDYAVPIGTPIKAVTCGTVLHAGWYGGSYLDNGFWIAPSFAGYCYVINHDPAPGFPEGFIGVYAHGQDGGTKVKAGQRVTEGQVIGLSGNTGGSTGPHLHFEILPDKFVVNGYMYGRVNPEALFGSAAIAPQGTTVKPIEGLSMADIDTITKQLATLLERTAPINTDGGATSLRQFIADGTRAAQKAANQTAPINVTGGQEGIRDFIAKGTRAAQSTAAQVAGLQAALSAVVKAGGSGIDLDAVTAAAEVGATKALANLDLTGTINIGGK